jgi:outer membrane protein assembly factor BamB
LTPTYARPLINYDTTTRAIVWKTAGFYDTTPALAKGVVYIARNAPTPVLEALSESDGHILWSWPIPAGDNSFYHNTIVPDNLVFVTTDKHIFAIDLATHAMVWSYEANGALALSRNGTLFVNTGAFNSDGHLLAIKMK